MLFSHRLRLEVRQRRPVGVGFIFGPEFFSLLFFSFSSSSPVRLGIASKAAG